MNSEYRDRMSRANAFQKLHDEYIPAVAEVVVDHLNELGGMIGDHHADAVFIELTDDIDEWDKSYEQRVMDNADEVTRCWPLTTAVEAASAYVHFGVVHSAWGNEEYTEDGWLSRQIKLLTEIVAKREAAGCPQVLKGLCELANARLALDTNQMLSPDALARLAGVTEGSIRNAMSGKSRRFDPVDGRIKSDEALAYLAERPSDFTPTIWVSKQKVEREPDPEENSPGLNVVFVPVSADGSVFHPGLTRSGKFTVGPKDNERKVSSFEEALSILQAAPAPNWRRPNNNGHWGNVLGVRWERKTTDELERLRKTA